MLPLFSKQNNLLKVNFLLYIRDAMENLLEMRNTNNNYYYLRKLKSTYVMIKKKNQKSVKL